MLEGVRNTRNKPIPKDLPGTKLIKWYSGVSSQIKLKSQNSREVCKRKPIFGSLFCQSLAVCWYGYSALGPRAIQIGTGNNNKQQTGILETHPQSLFFLRPSTFPPPTPKACKYGICLSWSPHVCILTSLGTMLGPCCELYNDSLCLQLLSNQFSMWKSEEPWPRAHHMQLPYSLAGLWASLPLQFYVSGTRPSIIHTSPAHTWLSLWSHIHFACSLASTVL